MTDLHERDTSFAGPLLRCLVLLAISVLGVTYFSVKRMHRYTERNVKQLTKPLEKLIFFVIFPSPLQN